MVKLLAIAVVLALGPGVGLVTAQTSSYFAKDSNTNAAPDVRIVSPEAKAEAKRLYKEGVKYGEAGLFSQAAQILERAVKLDPGNANAHYALGHAYFDLRQWKNAIGSFQRALDLNPKDIEARELLTLARNIAHQGPERPAPRVQNVRRVESAHRVESAPAPTMSTPPTTKSAQPQTTSAPPKVEVQVSMNAKPEPAPVQTEAPSAEVTSTEVTEAKEAPEVNAAANDLTLTKIYRVGPNDVLDIRINDSASPQSTLFTVTSSGLLEHPLLAEPLQAGGLTVDEISAKFEDDLKRRALLDNPKVSVGVRDYASHTILVSGLVKDSGTKILRREAIPLYVVVADAQPLPEAGRATVVRNESNETFEVELGEASEMNLLVRPGDVITLLANVTQFVYVGGEVKQPGEKTYRRGLTLTQAIIAAGGVTPKSKEARIGRDDGKGFLSVTRFKLKDIESGKVQDPVVKPGDRIMIVD